MFLSFEGTFLDKWKYQPSAETLPNLLKMNLIFSMTLSIDDMEQVLGS